MRSASFLTAAIVALSLCQVSKGGQGELEIEARALAKAGRDFLGRNVSASSVASPVANPATPANSVAIATEPPKAKPNLAPTSGVFKDPDNPVWIALGPEKKLEWTVVVDRLVLITNVGTHSFESKGPLIEIKHPDFGNLTYSNEADGLVLKLIASPTSPPDPKIPKAFRRQAP